MKKILSRLMGVGIVMMSYVAGAMTYDVLVGQWKEHLLGDLFLFTVGAAIAVAAGISKWALYHQGKGSTTSTD